MAAIDILKRHAALISISGTLKKCTKMNKLQLIEYIFNLQEVCKMKREYSSDEVVGMLNAISVHVAELTDADEAAEALSQLLAEGYIDSRYIEQAQARLRQLLSNT